MTLTDDISPITDADRESLREAVADLAASESSEEKIRAAIATTEGFDTELWSRMCAQLGLAGLLAPESVGGSASTFVELAVVLEELGRHLVPSPLISVSLAVQVLVDSRHEAAAGWLPRLIDGSLLAAIAIPQPAGGVTPLPDVLAVRTGGDTIALAGFITIVADGQLDGLLIVAARDPSTVGGVEDVSLYVVDAGASGVSRLPQASTDLTHRFARVEFVAAEAQRIGGRAELERLYSYAAAAYAAEQVGGAAAVLSDAVGYAMLREQFGKPIGSFQSIKHHCAEMLQAVESARATSRRAAAAIASEDPEVSVLATIAKACCSDAYANGAATNLHIHGGIGFTWEHSAHLHLRRAMSDQLLFGDAKHHRLVLADLLGL